MKQAGTPPLSLHKQSLPPLTLLTVVSRQASAYARSSSAIVMAARTKARGETVSRLPRGI